MLNRRPDESDLDYHRRLITGKLTDKTLADIDYCELAPLLYDQAYSSDSTRKMMYGSAKTLQLLDKEVELAAVSEVPREILDELEMKKIELAKERQRFFDQRREYNKLINAQGRFDYLTERLIDAANTLDAKLGLVVDQTTPTTVTHTAYDNEAVLALCDWHYGMLAHNAWNHYDCQTCIDRVNSIVGQTIEKLVLHGPKRLHVLLLGDLFHGAIHTSARVASEELVCDQLMQVSEIVAQAISSLAPYTPELIVHSTYGNHARTIQNKNDSIHRDNMERILPWWLKQRLRRIPNVAFASPSETEFIAFESCRNGICASHGDIDSVKDAPRLLPILIERSTGMRPNIIILADKHHAEEFEELGVTAMIADSLCGTDDYANEKRLYSSAGQLLFFVRDSGLDAVYRMRCLRN